MTSERWNLKEVLSKGAFALIVIVFVLVGLKGCVLSLWSSPKESVSYVIEGADKRSMRFTFFPNQETMIWYVDPSKPFSEGVLTRMRGTYGTHYFGPLWKVNGPSVFFGYRIYDEDVKPVMMEIEIIDKYIQGRGDPTFSSVGSTSHQILLFGKNRVMYQDMWLLQELPNPEVDLKLRSAFKQSAK